MAKINYASWMSDAKIQAAKLRNVCLPATHDSGAYTLQSPIVDEDKSPLFIGLINWQNEMTTWGNDHPKVRWFITTTWVEDQATSAVKGLSLTQRSSIADQLKNGIRCLDIRVMQDKNNFYFYHGLKGPSINDIVAEMKKFLSTTPGQILYVTFGHWLGFGGSDWDNFSRLILRELGVYAYQKQVDATGRIINNPFDKTVSEIVGGANTSKIIMVNEKSTDMRFWPGTFSPPDNTGASDMEISGFYTDTTDSGNMINTQKSQYQGATKPFALYMTLTPSGSDYANIVSTRSARQVMEYGLITLDPFLLELAAYLAIKGAFNDWNTLEELMDPVNRYMATSLNSIQKLHINGDQNKISFIYGDFYDSSPLVDAALIYSGLDVSPSIQQIAGIANPLAGNNVEIFALTEETKYIHHNTIGHSYYNGQDWSQWDWSFLGSPTASQMIARNTYANNINVFAADQTGYVYQIWYNSGSGWHDRWENISILWPEMKLLTVTQIDGAANPFNWHFELFAVDHDKNLWHNWLDQRGDKQGWQPWFVYDPNTHGNVQIRSAHVAVNTFKSGLDAYVVSVDDALWRSTFSNNNWSTWAIVESDLISDIRICRAITISSNDSQYNGHTALVVADNSGKCWYKVLDTTTDFAWVEITQVPSVRSICYTRQEDANQDVHTATLLLVSNSGGVYRLFSTDTVFGPATQVSSTPEIVKISAICDKNAGNAKLYAIDADGKTWNSQVDTSGSIPSWTKWGRWNS